MSHFIILRHRNFTWHFLPVFIRKTLKIARRRSLTGKEEFYCIYVIGNLIGFMQLYLGWILKWDSLLVICWKKNNFIFIWIIDCCKQSNPKMVYYENSQNKHIYLLFSANLKTRFQNPFLIMREWEKSLQKQTHWENDLLWHRHQLKPLLVL